MKYLKKRTLALVLASVVTVVGSFAETNYKNSLMSLSFKSSAPDKVDMLVQTKSSYNGNLNLIRKDVNTYVLTLPEVDSKASSPSLVETQGNIQSVDIRTMPYSNTSKGYTRVTIKTTPSINLIPKNEVFLPSRTSNSTVQSTINKPQSQIQDPRMLEQKKLDQERRDALLRQKQQEAIAKLNNENINIQPVTKEEVFEESLKDGVNEKSDAIVMTSLSQKQNTDGSENKLYYILAVILAITCIAYFYVKGKNKIQELTGESFEIDLSEDKKKKEDKKTDIKKTIKKLDSAYPTPTKNGAIQSIKPVSTPVFTSNQEDEPLNIVDLDELFQSAKDNELKSNEILEQETIENDENDALEAFLSGFSFEEEVEEEIIMPQEEEPPFDEEFLEQLLNSEHFVFSKTDISCINELLNSEINDETLKNISKYAVSNPIKPEVNKQKILEDLVTTYAISQNVVFNDNDIKILEKLMNVELDSSFVTDLRVNNEKTDEMEESIKKFHSESKVAKRNKNLEVKDLLPDLSEALKNQNGQAIKSDYKPQEINYHENCEVKSFSVDVELPDLKQAIDREESYVTKPSAKANLVDNSYEVSKLVIDFDLPDLKDAMAHPEKYKKEEEVFIPNEESLLNNLNNLTFKPFYDGSEQFEVINNLEEEEEEQDVELLTYEDIQHELEQFEGFAVAEEPKEINKVEELYPENLESYFEEENFIDLDKPSTIQESKAKLVDSISEEKFEPVKLERNLPKANIPRENSELSKDLMQRIQNRRESVAKEKNELKTKTQRINAEEKTEQIKCIIDDVSYTVVSTTVFNDKQGCHLAKKGNGYAVIAYSSDRFFVLKSYSELKSEKIQSRVSESFENGNKRFLVRIGLKKFIVDVSKGGIKFVMDLC